MNYTLNLFDDVGIPATFFCTDDLTESTFPSKSSRYELAIHPNYDDLNFKDETDISVRNFPHAVGSRSHRFMHGTPIINELKQHNIKYDSSILSYMHHITPFRLFNEIIEVPLVWSDDVALRIPKASTASLYNLRIVSAYFDPALYVLNFHPIHLYLNTESQHHYRFAKKYYHDTYHLMKRVNRDRPGTLTLFEELVTKTLDSKESAYTYTNLKDWVTQHGHEIKKVKERIA